MAARKHLSHAQKTRERIQASMLINRLENHALNNEEMSPTQIQAAKILLAKAVPDISSVEWTGELETNGTITHKIDDNQLDKIINNLEDEY